MIELLRKEVALAGHCHALPTPVMLVTQRKAELLVQHDRRPGEQGRSDLVHELATRQRVLQADLCSKVSGAPANVSSGFCCGAVGTIDAANRPARIVGKTFAIAAAVAVGRGQIERYVNEQ